MAIVIFLLIIGAVAYWFINRSVENHRHWQHTFDGVKFSAEEFYVLVQEAITTREIPDVRFSRVTYSEGGLLSGNREYLHIEKGEYLYDVCAAPYGTGFFVSLWYAERPSVTRKLLRKVQKKEFQELADMKSFYRIDTDGMANGAIRSGFNEAIEELTTTKGARALSETERKFF